MASSRRKRFKNPNWQPHVYTTFNLKGLSLLELALDYLKESSGLYRARWISAEDLACCIESMLRAGRITTFFREDASQRGANSSGILTAPSTESAVDAAFAGSPRPIRLRPRPRPFVDGVR